MSAARRALQAALAAEPTVDSAERHLSGDDLAAYHHRTASPAEVDRIQRHLVACAECTSLLLDLIAIARPDEPPLDEPELAAVWRGLAPHLHETPLPFHRPAAPSRSRSVLWPALAAALLASTIGLGWWTHQLSLAVDEARAPQLNLPVVDLFATGSRGSSTQQDLTLPAGHGWVTVVLNPEVQSPFDDYGVELRDEAGHARWSARGLVKGPYGSFTLGLPRDRLPAGRLALSLFGLRGEQRTSLGEYALEVEAP